MARVIIIHPGQPTCLVPPGKILIGSGPGLTLKMSESSLFVVCFCIAAAALLAMFVLGCDRNGRFHFK